MAAPSFLGFQYISGVTLWSGWLLGHLPAIAKVTFSQHRSLDRSPVN